MQNNFLFAALWFVFITIAAMTRSSVLAIDDVMMQSAEDDDDVEDIGIEIELPIYSTSISRATIRVILDFYVDVTSSLSVTRSSVDVANELRQAGCVNEVLFHTSARIAITNEDYWAVGEERLRFFNILFIDGYAAFRQIYANMNETIYDYTGYYTIVLTETSRYQYDTITMILRDCWALHITNVIVLVAIHPQARAAVYTYFPFTQFHCEAVAPVILNYFVQNRFAYNAPLFPRKALNLFGCPLLVAAYDILPFMILTLRPDGSYYTDGIDGILVRVLSQKLHFRPVVRLPPNHQGRGELDPNGTSWGALKMIYYNEVNFTIGLISYTAQRQRLLSASFPYYQSAIRFAVPRGKQFTAFQKLFMPFRYIIWTCLISLFAIGLCAIVALRFDLQRRVFVVGAQNPTPYLNMIAVFLGVSMTVLPRRNFARFLLTVWMMGCIVLRNAYQGSMFQFMSNSKSAPVVNSLDDMLANNYSLLVRKELFYLFDQIPKAKPILTLTPYENNSEEFKVLIAQRNTFYGAFLTTEAFLAAYNKRHKNETVQAAAEVLFSVSITILFKKHSCLTSEVNEQLHKYSSSGLLSHWVDGFVDRSHLRRNSESTGHRPLYLLQVEGVFRICAYLWAASVVVFALEVLSQRAQWLRDFFALIEVGND